MSISERLLVIVDADIKGAKSKLDSLGKSTESSASKMSSLAKGSAYAAAAIGAFAVGEKIVSELVGTFTEYAGKVREVQRASGASAEEASKLTYAFEKVGISSETGAKSIFQLSKRIGTGKVDLAQYGVAIAKTAGGGVNLEKTLLNIADAYTHTSDPAKRAALVTDSFGKAGQNLLPILAKGREGIKALFDEAGRTNHILDQGDLDRAKQFSQATKELSNTFEGLKIKAGNALTPLVTDITQMTTGLVQMADAVGVFDLLGKAEQVAITPLSLLVKTAKSFTNELGLTTSSIDRHSAAQKILTDNTEKLNRLISDGKGKTREAAVARDQIRLSTKALVEEQDAYNAATGATARAEDALAQKSDSYRAALDAVKEAKAAQRAGDVTDIEAQKQLAAAYDTVTAAVDREQSAILGSVDAGIRVQQQTQALAADVVKSADALTLQSDASSLAAAKADEYAQFIQATSGHVLTAKEKTDAYKQALVEIQAQFPQVAGATQPLIDKITFLQAHSDTHLKVSADTSAADAALDRVRNKIGDLAGRAFKLAVDNLSGGRAAGGPVSRGKSYVVGENGPEIFTPSSSGKILNARDSAARLRAIDGGGSQQPITVNAYMLEPSESAGRVLANSIRAHLRVNPRALDG